MWPLSSTPKKNIAAAINPANASNIPIATIAITVISAGAIA